MARTYAAILTSIWQDADFAALSDGAQHLYLFLLSQPALNQVGYISVTAKRWAAKSAGLTARDIELRLSELAEARFIVWDEGTDEVLVRTYVCNSGSWKQPLIVAAMAGAAGEIESPKLRQALYTELRLLPLETLSETLSPKGGPSPRSQVARRLLAVFEVLLDSAPTSNVSESETEPKPFPEPSREGFAEGQILDESSSGYVGDVSNVSTLVTTRRGSSNDDPEETRAVEEGVDRTPVRRAKVATVKPQPAERADVEQLCQRLADLMVENGCVRPEIKKSWRDAARLMLDKDGREFDKALRLLEWSQNDEFWKQNIHSMPTFRRQYDKLRLRALAEWGKTHGQGSRQTLDGAPVATGTLRALQAVEAGRRLMEDVAAGKAVGFLTPRKEINP